MSQPVEEEPEPSGVRDPDSLYANMNGSAPREFADRWYGNLTDYPRSLWQHILLPLPWSERLLTAVRTRDEEDRAAAQELAMAINDEEHEREQQMALSR